MPDKQNILDGLSEAIGHAKGIMAGHRINIYSASEFLICGMRYPAGRYEMKRVGDHPSGDQGICAGGVEIGIRACPKCGATEDDNCLYATTR